MDSITRATRFAATVLLANVAVPALANQGAPIAIVAGGQLTGIGDGHVDAFLGIPYAAPPTGAARWRAPGPAPAWTGARDATRFGANCWQRLAPTGFGPWTHEYVVQDTVSENCLFLNVWRPAHPVGRLPVLVWIHGGGFDSGSGAVAVYNGHNLARRGILVVSINYRLGVFGFLAHPELTREAAGGPPGNFGLMDQIAALRWVKANIAALGGDADRFAAVYPAGSDAERALAERQIRLDRGLAALWDWAQGRRSHGASPVYGYVFNHVEAGPEAARWGAFHSSELAYAFDTLDAAPERGYGPTDRQAMRNMSQYWINFIRTGAPAGKAMPVWPRFDPHHPQVMDIGAQAIARPVMPAARLNAYRAFIASGGVVSLF